MSTVFAVFSEYFLFDHGHDDRNLRVLKLEGLRFFCLRMS